MQKTLLALGIVGLIGFIGYGVYDVMGGRLPLLSYTMEAEKIVRSAERITDLHGKAGMPAADLKTAAAEMRAQFNAINSRCDPINRKRPSFKKLSDITDQIEAAAEKPESTVILTARMATVADLMREVKELLGKDADKPLP